MRPMSSIPKMCLSSRMRWNSVSDEEKPFGSTDINNSAATNTPGEHVADVRTPEERVAALVPMLSEDDPVVRKTAIIALGQLPCAPATEALCTMLEDPDEGVRVLTCQAPGVAADPACLTSLLRCVHDESVQVRSGILWVIAQIVAHGAIDDDLRAGLFTPAVVMAFDPDDGVRSDAASIIGTLHDARATDALLVLLEDDCAHVRANACVSLALLDTAEGLDALLAVAESSGEDPLVCVSALEGIARRGERGTIEPSSSVAGRVIDALCRLATTTAIAEPDVDAEDALTENDVHASAVWALGMIASLIRHHSHGEKCASVQTILTNALMSSDLWSRRYAAEACARLHDEAALEALRRCADDIFDADGGLRDEASSEFGDVLKQALATFEDASAI